MFEKITLKSIKITECVHNLPLAYFFDRFWLNFNKFLQKSKKIRGKKMIRSEKFNPGDYKLGNFMKKEKKVDKQDKFKPSIPKASSKPKNSILKNTLPPSTRPKNGKNKTLRKNIVRSNLRNKSRSLSRNRSNSKTSQNSQSSAKKVRILDDSKTSKNTFGTSFDRSKTETLLAGLGGTLGRKSATLNDLCEADKEKIGKLIQKLAMETKEKEKLR
jgi:hypothetical protein